MIGYGKLRLIPVLFFLLILFSGCSVKETVKSKSDEEILRDRVTEYWGYKIEEKFDKSYEFEYPVYRKNVSMSNYFRGFRPSMKWTKAEVQTIEMKDDAAEVTVKVDIKVDMVVPRIPKPVQHENKGIELRERWVKIDGLWYHVPKQR
ncbi:hypothetical protein NBG4_180023 [Candidatus Sulfobium mesophilum]|uniref:Lipoprotein n=1 Tax=Candidatus Sulfobium mesophilum TaxID=2016548 RepID=A0A2U3QFF6_9BACT|nr:hypothetical protein NBG4_180023 [Candidatus Sulfobium mesophilum]